MKKDFDKKNIILIAAVVFLIIANIILYNSTKSLINPENGVLLNSTVNNFKEQEIKGKQIKISDPENEVLEYLRYANERERMEFYCAEYLNYVEGKDYKKAYDLLYSKFKEQYFPKYEDYVQYMETTYPSEWAVQYDDISRQGNLYVIRLILIDTFGERTEQGEKENVQRIVIQENDFNDFVMSFQVI